MSLRSLGKGLMGLVRPSFGGYASARHDVFGSAGQCRSPAAQDVPADLLSTRFISQSPTLSRLSVDRPRPKIGGSADRGWRLLLARQSCRTDRHGDCEERVRDNDQVEPLLFQML